MTILQKAKILAAWNKLAGLLEELEAFNSDQAAQPKIRKILEDLEGLL